MALLIDQLFDEMISKKATDLYLTVGLPPCLRMKDTIHRKEDFVLTNEDTDLIVKSILTPDQQQEFEETKECNVSVCYRQNYRFRVNVFRQQQQTGLVIRRVQTNIPTFEELKLPEVFKSLIMRKRGLIFISGATGSGKSMTLAAMLNHRNRNSTGHIITVEDPIEYVHPHDKCIFTQREIGIDTMSYAAALQNALRQHPDVIAIGEIRDRETMEEALRFSETGHLCIATVHAKNSIQTINRAMNLFPKNDHHKILAALSQQLAAIISQRLVTATDGNQILATGLLLNEGSVKTLIEEGRFNEISDLINKGDHENLYSIDRSLIQLYEKGLITQETLNTEADDIGNIRLHTSKQKMLDTQKQTNIANKFELKNGGSTNQF